jgi:hypothetical protein
VWQYTRTFLRNPATLCIVGRTCAGLLYVGGRADQKQAGQQSNSVIWYEAVHLADLKTPNRGGNHAPAALEKLIDFPTSSAEYGKGAMSTGTN